MLMRSMTAATLLVLATAGLAPATSSEMCDDPPCTKAQIEAYERRVGKHMLRTQQARFQAMARGESQKTKRYDREFKRTQQRWIDAKRALETAND